MALLLGHAAFLGEKKGTRRRAALWYLSSADRLEKGGVVRLSFVLLKKSPLLTIMVIHRNPLPCISSGNHIRCTLPFRIKNCHLPSGKAKTKIRCNGEALTLFFQVSNMNLVVLCIRPGILLALSSISSVCLEVLHPR